MILLDGATGTELGRRGIDTRTSLFSAAALLDERVDAFLDKRRWMLAHADAR
jgi:S-methylmethionine-dependent homocysteine/selenocysteine methylase